MWVFLVVPDSVNGLAEQLESIPGVSASLTGFKEEVCFFYIKTNIDLLYKTV